MDEWLMACQELHRRCDACRLSDAQRKAVWRTFNADGLDMALLLADEFKELVRETHDSAIDNSTEPVYTEDVPRRANLPW